MPSVVRRQSLPSEMSKEDILKVLSDRIERKIVGSLVFEAIQMLPDNFDEGQSVLLVDMAMALATDFSLQNSFNSIIDHYKLRFPKEWMTAPSGSSKIVCMPMLAILGHILFLFPTKCAMKEALSSQEILYRKAYNTDNDTDKILWEFGTMLREDSLFEELGSTLAKKFPGLIKSTFFPPVDDDSKLQAVNDDTSVEKELEINSQNERIKALCEALLAEVGITNKSSKELNDIDFINVTKVNGIECLENTQPLESIEFHLGSDDDSDDRGDDNDDDNDDNDDESNDESNDGSKFCRIRASVFF